MTTRPGPTRFMVTMAADGRPPVVRVSGDIDLANVAEFDEALARARTDSPVLAVDLTGVTYCDSAAVRALFTVAAATELTMLVPPAGHIKTLLRISGLDRVATVIVGE